MIDLKLLRDEPDAVRASQRIRGENEGAVDALLAADDARRAAVTRADGLRAQQKTIGREVARASADTRPAVLARAKQLADDVKAAEAEQADADAALRRAHLAIANIVEDGVPPGGEDDFALLERVGTPPSVENPKDHLEIGNALKAIDTERGAKVSGSRFYFLTGIGAQLEFALTNLAMAQAMSAGFTPVIAPSLVKPEIMAGTGFLGAHASEVYHLDKDDDLYLVGTSEVALAGYHSDEILDAASLPLRYAGFSSCFRREAGSYGKDTKGIIRVHWFDKVEMFSYVPLDDAHDEHRRLLAWERQFIDSLELTYRVIDVAAGDLGSSAVRKFDIEAWFPSQGTYRELTSTSNCTTFQSRRLNIRTRGTKLDDNGRRIPSAGTEPVATLNGTLCAISRTIACLLDHHQQPDGSVYVPAALRPFLGGLELFDTAAVIKLVATDLDGTLLRTDNTVSDRTRAALRNAEAAGLLVVFVTGRPPRWLDAVVNETGHIGVAVGANGAVVYDMATEQIVNSHTLDVALVHELTTRLRDAFPAVAFAIEIGHDFAAEPDYTHDWPVNPEVDRRGVPIAPPHFGTLAEIVTAPALKLLAKDRGADPDAFAAAATALVGDRATITHSSSFGLLELSAPGVTKATGLAEIAATHGIDASEVAAIGDMPNDVPMLQWAGRSYAVANAHHAAAAAADETVGANDEDAVAVLIESVLAAHVRPHQ